ncbi:MAG: hypothetical protein LBH11_04475 [Propionibacteriaceae bacterium]|nr:hypothetical protein [Propionibacteriaceae bacterium]
MSIKKRITCLLATLVTAMVLVACSSENFDPQASTSASPTPGQRLADSFSAWAGQVLVEQNEYLSDFAKEVIGEAARTGRIAASAYEQAFSMYAACMAERGFDDTYVKDGFGVYGVKPGEYGNANPDAYSEAFPACWDGNAEIAALWAEQQYNPGLLVDTREVALECLLDNDFIDSSYTLDDLEATSDDGFLSAPFDPMDPVANDCLRAGGMVVTRG